MTESLMALYGLPGMGSEPLWGIHARSVAGVMRGIKTHDAVMSSGYEGILQVWRVDRWLWGGSFQRFGSSPYVYSFRTKKDLREWLVEWLPRCYQSE